MVRELVCDKPNYFFTAAWVFCYPYKFSSAIYHAVAQIPMLVFCHSLRGHCKDRNEHLGPKESGTAFDRKSAIL